jgi:hypothetical protein
MTDPQSFEIFQSVEIFHSWDLYDNIVRNNWMMHREDRSGFIARIEQEIQSRWIPMPSEHRHDAIEHIRNYDFPEQKSWMIDIWESNSQNQRSPGNPIEYRDAFYIALRLAAG